MRIVTAVVVALWLLAAPALTTVVAQTPTFRTGIAVVPLDVRVVDRKGNPINDLTRNDFTVFEDGVRQEITHFERQALAPASATDQPTILVPGTSITPGVRAQNRRVFFIQLGRQWLPGTRFGMVKALTTFLRERLMPQDYAAVAAFGRVTDLTTNHDALAEVIERLAAYQTSIDGPAHRREMRALYAHAARVVVPGDDAAREALDAAFAPASSGTRLAPRPVRKYERVLDSIEASGDPPPGSISQAINILSAIEYLRFVDGEKHLIYTNAIWLPSGTDDHNLARIASDARVAIHAIVANGLNIGQLYTTGKTHPSEQLLPEIGTRNVAALTGGRASIDRYPEEALTKIDQLTRVGYLLAYSPSKSDADGRDRKITIKVTRPGATVMARETYVAADKAAEYDWQYFAAQDRIMTVAEYPGGLAELGVKVKATAKAKTADVDVQVDFSQVTSTLEAGRHNAKLEVVVFCTDTKERLVGQRWMTLDLKLKDETFARAMAEGFHHAASVPVTGTVRYVKVVVYDYATDRAGSVVVKVG